MRWRRPGCSIRLLASKGKPDPPDLRGPVINDRPGRKTAAPPQRRLTGNDANFPAPNLERTLVDGGRAASTHAGAWTAPERRSHQRRPGALLGPTDTLVPGTMASWKSSADADAMIRRPVPADSATALGSGGTRVVVMEPHSMMDFCSQVYSILGSIVNEDAGVNYDPGGTLIPVGLPRRWCGGPAAGSPGKAVSTAAQHSTGFRAQRAPRASRVTAVQLTWQCRGARRSSSPPRAPALSGPDESHGSSANPALTAEHHRPQDGASTPRPPRLAMQTGRHVVKYPSQDGLPRSYRTPCETCSFGTSPTPGCVGVAADEPQNVARNHLRLLELQKVPSTLDDVNRTSGGQNRPRPICESHRHAPVNGSVQVRDRNGGRFGPVAVEFGVAIRGFREPNRCPVGTECRAPGVRGADGRGDVS